MSSNSFASHRKKTVVVTIMSVIMSLLSVTSFGSIYSLITPLGYYGDNIFAYTPLSLIIFAVTLILLLRFFKSDIWSNKRRIVISCIVGILLSVAALFSVLMLYGNNAIVNAPLSIPLQIITTIGMAFFFIPVTSELIGVTDLFEGKDSCNDMPSKPLYYEKNNLIYFFFVWLLIFLSFVPLFLYTWPGNFICDAGWQVRDYIEHRISTHHPILHTLLLGFFYDNGLKKGDIAFSFQIFTLIQMLILSASFAFFLKYVKEKGVSRRLRITLFLIFVLNPVNGYYAVSTVKGVIGAAFFVFAVTFLMKLFDQKSVVLNSVFFVLTAVLSCHFRNNLVYAIVASGIIIAVFKQGLKSKLLIFTLTIVIFIGYKGSLTLLMKATDAPDVDGARESLSVPLMCLAHVAIDEKNSLDPIIYNEIVTYINEDDLQYYSMAISDSIKGNANEALLRSNLINFFKLFAKVGLKYPGKYLEAVTGLTSGYYMPICSPYFVTGSTKIFTVYIPGDYEQIAVTNKLPVGSAIFNYLYGDSDGRMKLPLLGLLWRCSTYFWAFTYAFMYLIYKKKYNNLFVLLFPFLYMLSCLFGPCSYLRYLYINIAALPIALYLALCKDTTSSEEVRD